MITKELIKKIKHIEIQTNILVNNMFGGEYHSAFKGIGMEFNEVREYIPGDDIRNIDWNVTAKYQKPFIKIYEEERELNVIIAIDISGSSYFGLYNQFKKDAIIEIASILALSAIKNNDKVGIILFSDIIELYIPPNKGRTHILRLIREMLMFQPNNKRTDLSICTEYIIKIIKRKSVIFFISDFFDKNYYKSFKILNQKHDLINIQINDIYEFDLTNYGMVKIIDNESNKEIWVDLNNNSKLNHNYIKNFSLFCNKNNIDIIMIENSDNNIKPLIKFFKKRIKSL